MKKTISFSIAGRKIVFISEINEEGKMTECSLSIKMTGRFVPEFDLFLQTKIGLIEQDARKIIYPTTWADDEYTFIRNYSDTKNSENIFVISRIFFAFNQELKDLFLKKTITLQEYLEQQAKLFECKKYLCSVKRPNLSYNLAVMSHGDKRERGTIYLANDLSDAGLKYEMVDFNGKPIKHTIPWKNFPENFPFEADKIIQSKNIYLPIILNQMTSRGYAASVSDQLNESLSEITLALPPKKGNSRPTKSADYISFEEALPSEQKKHTQSEKIKNHDLTLINKINTFITGLDQYIKERANRNHESRSCFDFFSFYNKELSKTRYEHAVSIKKELVKLLSNESLSEELKKNQLTSIIVEARRMDIQHAIEHDKSSDFRFKRSKLNQLFIQPACDYLISENFIYAEDLSKEALKPSENAPKLACCSVQ